jgi:predicted O-methyltransferase YrrM
LHAEPRRKVIAFILRRTATGHDRLLVHTFLRQPELPWRAPGGGVHAGETPEAALWRELAEEAGLERLPGLTVVRKLGVHGYFKPYLAADVERHDYLLRVDPAAPARWTQRVSGDGGDAGELFGYHWIDADEVVHMDEEHGAYVRPDYIPELFAPAGEVPPQLAAVEAATQALGFAMASDRATGMLLRTLAASKPGGNLLELGTGTGLATAWLLHGMDAGARLLSVDDDATVQAVAVTCCGDDPRLTLATEDGDAALPRLAAAGERFDLIFADTWPGKYRLLDLALKMLNPGGFYIVDDLLPQPNWPPGHDASVARLVGELQNRTDLWIAQLDWSTGLLVAVKRPPHP